MIIGIYGGAFDPFTLGHANVVKHLFDKNLADFIIIVPCYISLTGKKMTSFDHRINMCNLCLSDTQINNKTIVTDIEKYQYNSGLTETPVEPINIINKIKEFANSITGNEINKFFFIMGLDNALNVDKWKNFELVKNTIDFYIFPRTMQNSNYQYDNLWFTKEPHKLLDYNMDDISSTLVRNNVKNNKIIHVSPSVEKYIVDNKLYV